jgi:ATP-dependent Clp protease adapter protein ClpS
MPERRENGEGNGLGSAVVTQTKPKTQKPSLYRVLILNDDYTPMEFVVYVLERFFNKTRLASCSTCTSTEWGCAACSPTKLPKPKSRK